MTGDKTLTALFGEELTLTVNIDKNSGTGTPPSVDVTNMRTNDSETTETATANFSFLGGDEALLAETPGNYDFLGWVNVTDENNTISLGARPEIAFSVEDDTEVTAYFATRESYCPGHLLDLVFTVHYPPTETVTALALDLTLPDGWTYDSIYGTSPAITPAADATGTLEFIWIHFGLAAPRMFTIHLDVPSGLTTNQELSYATFFRTNGGQLQTDTRTKTLVPAPSGCTGASAGISVGLVNEASYVSQYQAQPESLVSQVQEIMSMTTLEISPLAQCGTVYQYNLYHSSDTNFDFRINLSELLRVVQLYNSDGLHCQSGTEDGYAPDSGDISCRPHDSDYNLQNWQISMSELLRTIQFFNSRGYLPCED